MIPEIAIKEWKKTYPWQSDYQVEQDLLICKALVAIYNDEFLAKELAFRGGTALHKLYLSPQPRYSEDIDLVQINAGPIKQILQRLGEVLNFFPNKEVKQKRFNNTVLFRMESEIPPKIQLRIKIEINCFEHFTELGYIKFPFSVNNSWFSGKAEITTYCLEELLGTKLRALYQRRKGRDLFDIYYVLSNQIVDIEKLIKCYRTYMNFVVDKPPTQKEFILNVEQKISDPEFIGDIKSLLRPDIIYNEEIALQKVTTEILEKI